MGTVMEFLAEESARDRRNLLHRLLAATQPGSAIRWLRTDLVPARSRSGPAQRQATRRFLASIDRVRGAAIQARCCLALVGRDRFHQGHQLTLYSLILDLAVGAQQPQAECAVQEQQALYLARLAVAVVEERHRHVERGSDLLKTSRADAVDAL